MNDTLDLADVAAFVATAEQASFTRAARLLGSPQSSVSLRVKRLEAMLGRRLLERTPRHVQLSPDGARFLDAARRLLDAHDAARSSFAMVPPRIVVGISHHVVGARLPAMLEAAASAHGGYVLDLRIASSRETLAAYDAGDLDAAFILDLGQGRRDGLPLADAQFIWAGSPSFAWPRERALPVVAQPAPCTLRSIGLDALDAAGIAWIEAFVGGGTATIGAAAAAGFGVAVMVRQAIAAGTVDVGMTHNLPSLPRSAITLHCRTADPALRKRLSTLGEILFG